jgi:hypothetical protein
VCPHRVRRRYNPFDCKEEKQTMTKLWMAALVCCLLATSVPVWAQNAPAGTTSGIQAVITLTDPVNYSDLNQVNACTSPADAPFPAVNSYSLTLTAPKRVTIGTKDCCCIGDYYDTKVDGNLFNRTPNPADYCAEGTDSWGCWTGTCTPLSEGYTTACLPAGTYAVTVENPGFTGKSAQEIADENMCPAGFTQRFHTESTTACTCAEVQRGVILVMPEPTEYKNHGQYVAAAAHTLASIATVSPECQSCIINQFARRVPQSEMVVCNVP